MTLLSQSDSEKTENVAETRVGLEEQVLFKARSLFIFGEITDKLALTVCQRLFALSEAADAPITLFVSSPGGHLESGDAVHDMIRFVHTPITVIGTGWVGSAATHIFLAVPRDKRVCLPNTRFLIHQPAGGMGGQASDIAIQAEQLVRARERTAKVIAMQTGQPYDKVIKDIDRDYWMDSDEAKAYGLISRIITKKADIAT